MAVDFGDHRDDYRRMSQRLCHRHGVPAPVTCSRCGFFLCEVCLFDKEQVLCIDCGEVSFATALAQAKRTRGSTLVGAGLVLICVGLVFFLAAVDLADYETFAGTVPKALMGRSLFGGVLTLIGLVFSGLGVRELVVEQHATSDTSGS